MRACVQKFELATQPQTVLKYRMASDKDALWLLPFLTFILVQQWQIGGVVVHELELAYGSIMVGNWLDHTAKSRLNNS